jgi:hypothetical protein
VLGALAHDPAGAADLNGGGTGRGKPARRSHLCRSATAIARDLATVVNGAPAGLPTEPLIEPSPTISGPGPGSVDQVDIPPDPYPDGICEPAPVGAVATSRWYRR